MKQAVICAVQIVLIWINMPAKAAEEQEKILWIFHSSLNSQLYLSDKAGKSNSHQQHGQYTGSTVKPLKFAWFHGGLKSRWTQSAGLSEVYSEPASLKLAAGLKVYKNLVYAMAGMTLPLVENQIPESDTSSYTSIMNDFSLLTEQNIMTLNSVNAGGYLNHTLGSVNGKLGLSYYRPSSYELFENNPNFHTDLLNYRLQLSWQIPLMFNTFEAKLTTFGNEKDRNISDSPAHSEGSLSQFYYAAKFHVDEKGLETGLGVALRGKDANRTSLEAGDNLKAESKNSNIQRYYLNLVWAQALWKQTPLIVRISPQFLTRESTDASGFQTNVNLGYKFKISEKNIMHIKSFYIFGSLDEETVSGGGLSLSLTFHGAKNASAKLFPKRVEKSEED